MHKHGVSAIVGMDSRVHDRTALLQFVIQQLCPRFLSIGITIMHCASVHSKIGGECIRNFFDVARCGLAIGEPCSSACSKDKLGNCLLIFLGF